jgi:hypothetical protein
MAAPTEPESLARDLNDEEKRELLDAGIPPFIVESVRRLPAQPLDFAVRIAIGFATERLNNAGRHATKMRLRRIAAGGATVKELWTWLRDSYKEGRTLTAYGDSETEMVKAVCESFTAFAPEWIERQPDGGDVWKLESWVITDPEDGDQYRLTACESDEGLINTRTAKGWNGTYKLDQAPRQLHVEPHGDSGRFLVVDERWHSGLPCASGHVYFDSATDLHTASHSGRERAFLALTRLQNPAGPCPHEPAPRHPDGCGRH